jgi:hypothetical protein
VALHVTVVVPSANVLPDGGEQVAGSDPSTMSLAPTAGHVTAVPAGSLVEAVIGAGAATDGGVVSCTVTVIELATVSPFSSVAVQVTGVDPIGYCAVTSKSPEPLPPGLQAALIGLLESGSNAFTL